MKKTLLALLLLAASHSWAQQTVYDANAVKRSVGKFHGIDAATGVEVIITKGDEEALAISCSSKEMDEKVITEVVNGVLKIYVENDWKVWKMPNNWKVKVYVAYKDLDIMKASSGASIKGEVNTSTLNTKQSSGGFILLKGAVDKLEVDASSGGYFRGYDLVANYLIADVSSGGGIQITVNKEISAEASSGGYVTYKGTAIIRDIDISSGGTVKKSN